MLKTRKCQKIKICKVLEKLISHQKKKTHHAGNEDLLFWKLYIKCVGVNLNLKML